MLSRIKQLFKKTGNSKGQAMTEYILVLIVVVFVIFGILYQFNSAFQKFASSYIGDYFACLLEYGELPNLGGQSTTPGECDAQFEDFDIAKGVNPLGPGLGQGNDDTDSDKKNKNADGRGSAQGAGGSSGSGRDSIFGNRSNRNANKSYVRGSSPSGVGDSGDDPDDDLFGSARPITPANNYTVSTLRPRTITIPFASEEDKKKKETKKATANIKEETNLKPQRLQLRERTLRKTASMEESSNYIGFSGFIRFLFVTAIVIALIILLGGQALQISKEWD